MAEGIYPLGMKPPKTETKKETNTAPIIKPNKKRGCIIESTAAEVTEIEEIKKPKMSTSKDESFCGSFQRNSGKLYSHNSLF